MKNERMILGGTVLALVGWIVYSEYNARQDYASRGSATRHVTGPSIRGSALDVSLGQITPDHLLWFGPTARPPGWVPHKVTYPALPGQNLEILINGAPGCCAVAVPREQRGWLFCPPSEVDY